MSQQYEHSFLHEAMVLVDKPKILRIYSWVSHQYHTWPTKSNQWWVILDKDAWFKLRSTNEIITFKEAFPWRGNLKFQFHNVVVFIRQGGHNVYGGLVLGGVNAWDCTATWITRGLLVQWDTTSMDSWNDDETNGNNKLPNMLLYETLRLQQNVLRVFQQ